MFFSFYTPSINIKTKVKPFSGNFSNPVFAQKLSFRELELQTLWLTFLSFDASSRHEVIGQVVLPLADLNLSCENVFQTDIRPSLKVNERLWCSKKNLNKKTQGRWGLHSTREGLSWVVLVPLFPGKLPCVLMFPQFLLICSPLNSRELKQGRRNNNDNTRKQWSDWLNEEK